MFNTNSTGIPVSIPLNTGGFGGGFGNDFDSIIALAIIAMIFGWNNGGVFGGGGVQNGYVLNSDFSAIARQLSDGFATQERRTDAIINGLSSIGYENLTNFNGIMQGINNSMVNDSNNTRDILTAINDCCCKNQTAFLNAQYNAANEACATRQAITDAKADILAYLNAEKMADLQAENQGLRLAASQQAQNNYLINQLRPAPTPAYVVQNPYCNCNYGNVGYYGGTTIA